MMTRLRAGRLCLPRCVPGSPPLVSSAVLTEQGGALCLAGAPNRQRDDVVETSAQVPHVWASDWITT